MQEKNIWIYGVKAILGFHKKNLLDYLDAQVNGRKLTDVEKELVSGMKGKIHNDLSAATISISFLMETLNKGGDISPLGSLIDRNNKG